MEKLSLAEETLGYQTVQDPTNTDQRYLIGPSKNVLIDQNKKVRSRPGFTRLGSGSTDLNNVKAGKTWNTSKEDDLPLRFIVDRMEVYLGTIDGLIINDWKQVCAGLPTVSKARTDFWYDDTEGIDLALSVFGTGHIFEWSGAVAIVQSIPDGTHVTKAGTATWGANRFYTTRNKVMICVRTGTEYTYTSGEGTTTLVVTDSTGLLAGDILVQKVVDNAIASPADRNAYTIFQFENQIFLGSEEDENVFVSKNTNFNDFTYSAPRQAGEGGIATLTDPVRGFGVANGDLIIFCGPSAAFKAVYQQQAVDTVLAESLTFTPIKSIGAQQGALNQESIISVGNALAYLSNEVALRMLDADTISGELQLHTLSNPIKPDFDAEIWDDAAMIWAENAVCIAAPTNSHCYFLQYVEDSNGNLSRFWQPPQVLPVQCWSIINEVLHGHSNSVPETYVMFDGLSDYIANATMGEPDDKVSIETNASYAYRTFGKRGVLKCFDEYFVDGEINANTPDLKMTLNYDFGGHRQVVERTIDGTDEGILQGLVGQNSLAQASLGTESLTGLLLPPADARKFNVNFEYAKDDFMLLQPVFSSNEIDRYWAILANGPNVTLSPRKNIAIKR